MNISVLCENIGLQPHIRDRVFSFAEQFDFKSVDEQQKGYFIYENMDEALRRTQAILGEDADGCRILACMLRASVNAYEVYRTKGIPDGIYFATMKCYTRFIDETYRMTGKLCFDRYWWTARQAGCHEFRIGELEYEMKQTGEAAGISIHVPSDADFSPAAVEKSLQAANEFFARYYPSLSGAEYRCDSWLLDSRLKGMLGDDSNIISFQNRFEIIHEGEAGTDFARWVFKTASTDYAEYPENTSLQRNMKKHLLSGGVIRNACGRIKAIH